MIRPSEDRREHRDIALDETCCVVRHDSEECDQYDHDRHCCELILADIVDRSTVYTVLEVDLCREISEECPLHCPEVVTCCEHHREHSEYEHPHLRRVRDELPECVQDTELCDESDKTGKTE